MPFYKYVIQTNNSDKNKVPSIKAKNENECDETAFANQRLVNILYHISQLVKIAEDVFGIIEIECKSIHERTTKLDSKIQHCKEIVDNLNAKTVKVPVGSLSDCQTASQHFKSCDAEKIDKLSIFSKYPLPAAVEKLRDLAHGPSPPVIIPFGMVASEVDDLTGSISGSNTSTHIYCKPVTISYDKTRSSLETAGSNGQDKKISDDEKVPSSVVAIDVSGQPFSRMSSFRRSLIHVDFLIRRKKKKDKRRNTVTEGEVKDLKNALKKIETLENHCTIQKSSSAHQQISVESKNDYNNKFYSDKQSDKNPIEENNNAANINSSRKASYTIIDDQISTEEKNQNILQGKGQKKEQKSYEHDVKYFQSSKRKPKSHIPISTVSAAMNVAVEMRQCNGVKKETPVFNGVSNDDSDCKLEDKMNSTICNEDSLDDESWSSYKKRLQEKCKTLTNRKLFDDSLTKDSEISSSASSENIDLQDNVIATTTPTDSDTYFISSDESDEDSSDALCFQDNCGSSISLGTVSDGSLNSLLSETGTEMTSSTGTLTSVGQEHILSSTPPPPPPMILSATVTDSDLVEKTSNSICIGSNLDSGSRRHVKTESKFQKQGKQSKPSKHIKTDMFGFQRNKCENPKNIFTSLVSLKSHSKEKTKSKDVEKKNTYKNSHQPAFDMYGNSSPTKAKHVPTFIKENISPIIQKEEKNSMKSFLANDKSKFSFQMPYNEDKSKSNYTSQPEFMCKSSYNASDTNSTIQNVSIIPSKYTHQVTVTPVQRCTEGEKKNSYSKGSFSTENQQNLGYSNTAQPNAITPVRENHAYVPKIQRPPPPVSLQPQEKLTARVVLDFDGKVLYTTNSLDRKHHIPSQTVNIYNSTPNPKACELHPKDRRYNNDNFNKFSINRAHQNLSTHCTSNAAYLHSNASKHSSFCMPIKQNNTENSCEDNWLWKNDQYLARQKYTATSISETPKIMRTFVPKRSDIRPFSYAGNTSDMYLQSNNLLPDPNVSGLPIQEATLTRHNVTLHAKQMEKMNIRDSKDSFKKASDNFNVSASSQTNNTLIKSPQSTMSTEDLFTVIHNYKKRMNIKTDSDLSLASSSSRSSSPSYLRPSSSKGTLAETGFLSPRSHAHLEVSGDRRSWADFRPVDSMNYERKSLASDRLGPIKPTSMHDFKMLLLQARSSSQISGPRKSAVEMLKLPLNQSINNKTSPLPLNSPPKNCISAQNSPTMELNLCNGHSTVPFKRGNRVRTSLQSRYIMYPPIFEDCSEDLENCADLISNKPLSNTSDKGDTIHKDNFVRKQTSNNNNESDQELCDNEINRL